MATTYTLEIAQRTDIGRTRTNNEDNLIAFIPDDQHILQTKGTLFVVSDGLGGHDNGEVASELTVQTIKDYYYNDTHNTIPTALQEAVKQANTAIYSSAKAREVASSDKTNMGATGVVAVLHEQTLYTANVGDSRVYILRAGQLQQITRDHSVVAQLIEKGEITRAEARTHEQRNIITRCLGNAPEVEVDLHTEAVHAGETLILCTDGLYNMLEEDEIRTIVEQYEPAESVQQLIANANAKGGTGVRP